jgi:glycine oxidase
MLAPAFEAALEEASSDRAALYRLGRDLWPELAERVGIALDRRGADWIGPAEPLADRMAALGFRAERTQSGFSTPDDWALDPEDALARMASYILQGGGEIRPARVSAIETGPGPGGLTVQAQDQAFKADAVVVAAGWAAPRIVVEGLAPLFDRVRPIKGHILELAGGAAERVERVTRGPGVYLAPRRDGLIVGASMQPDRDDTAIEPEVVASLRRAAEALFPELRGASLIEARAGVRGATADGLPLAGETVVGGVHVALAPRRNGWLLAPLVARCVAASILGGEDPAGGMLRPDRYQLRA